MRIAPLTTLVTSMTALVLSLPFGMQDARAELKPVTTPISHVYAPKGFDANDVTQIAVSGYLPNLCYKAPQAEVSVVGRVISIQMKALFNDGTMFCPQMIVPYLEPVSVGVLPKGHYRVVVNAGHATESRSSVSIVDPKSASEDNHVYANVSYIDKAPGYRRIVLKGENPSDCFEFDRIEFVSNGEDTYSVLPILKQVKPDCPLKKVPFSIEAQVPGWLPIEELLLHVRAMDGKSVNLLFDNR
jgi:hypothetical protein